MEDYSQELVHIPDQDVRNQFLGIPTDAEARKLVRKTFRIPKEVEAYMDNMVQDRRLGFESFDHLVGQAVWCLLKAFTRMGYPDDGLDAELEYLRSIRAQSYRSSRRNEIREAFHRYDDELDAARRQGDWRHIISHLRLVDRWFKEAPSESVRQTLEQVASQSLSIQAAVKWLIEWVAGHKGEEVVGEIEGDLARWTVLVEEWLPRA